MYGGANARNRDALNMNIDRDFSAKFEEDIAMVSEGMETLEGKKLLEKRGIEVGNIFQLGYHYTKLMSGAEYVDEDGSLRPYYMGCYGIGLGRTMATLAELFHDERGLRWPEAVAPFQAHLVSLGNQESGIINHSEDVYDKLIEAGIEVLWDDRDESPGKKFAVADLIGCPVRLVVSPKTGDKIEWKRRDSSEVVLVTIEDVIGRLCGAK
jgi:prolyl-tRNA synthetase